MQYRQGRSRVVSAVFKAPAAADTDAILSAVTDTGEDQEISEFDGQPDVPRVITATAGGTAADIGAVQVIVEGTNTWGETITETLPAFTVNTAGSVTGSKAFNTVTKVTIPAHDGTGATTAIGYEAKLGLPDALPRNTLVAAFLDGTRAGSLPTVAVDADEVEKNIVTVSGLNGAKDYIVDYYTGGE